MKILLVDDNVKIRTYVHGFLTQKLNTLDRIYECGDGETAIRLYNLTKPDWVLMDIKLPSISGLEATRRILTEHPTAKVIIVTQYDDAVYRDVARRAGAQAYILKENLDDVLRVIAALPCRF
jgi:DNA-binding NarL/FixJ family response regulator